MSCELVERALTIIFVLLRFEEKQSEKFPIKVISNVDLLVE
jgi:hypothetical protein